MKKQFTIFLILVFVLGLVPVNFSSAATLSNKLKGKILLQVESKGEAWYVNPKTGEKNYMANGDEAYNIMRNLGVGITNKDLEKIQNNKNSAVKHSGKIFLQVESKGEAYYVDFNGILHYLKNGSEAYSVMRNLGLGITNKDLEKIPDKLSAKTETSNLKKLTNSEIIQKVKQAVVYIETTEGTGSGMIIESNGYILTNAHVVTGVNSAKIYLYNGISNTGSVIGRDENLDLALLKIDSNNYLKVNFGDSDKVEQGDEVFALGFPFGIKGDVSFKEGTISRKINDSSGSYFETSAQIHPGNSGGPLVNQYGEVIGINSGSIGQSVNGVMVGETIKLAIPSNVAISLIPSLKNGLNVIDTKAQEQKEAEAQAQEQAKQAEAEKQAQLKREAQQKVEALQAEIAKTEAALAKKQALIAQMNLECNDPINAMKQQIIQLKADYYKKVEAINNQDIPSSFKSGQTNSLIAQTNAQINIINNNIQQKQLECSIKLRELNTY